MGAARNKELTVLLWFLSSEGELDECSCQYEGIAEVIDVSWLVGAFLCCSLESEFSRPGFLGFCLCPSLIMIGSLVTSARVLLR